MDMDLPGYLRDTAARLPDKPALLVASSDVTLTYGALDAEVDRVAAALQGLGLKKGDRVAVGLPNSPEFVIAYFAVLRAGGVMIPLNIMLTPSEIKKVFFDSGTEIAITMDPFMEGVRKGAESTRVRHFVCASDWNTLEPKGSKPQAVDLSDDDLAVLAYTSGTTGEPKGAMLTHGNLRANLEQQMQVPESMNEDDVLFLTLPMFHIFGLNVPLGLMVMNGATGVIADRFEPVDALRTIERFKPTVLFGAPPMYNAWINVPGADQYDLSSVRLAVSGAAPLSEEVLKGFKGIFGVQIFEGYGMTETAPTLTTNRMTDEPRAMSVGKPLPGVEIRLIDEEGNPVELGDPGEIVVRGPNVFKGYWNREEETAKSFIDGWFRTGDVAVMDEEGYIYLVDRKRDLIIVSGFNVFPSEVEAALLANPKIAEAAVVGEPHPYTGEAVKAFVVLAEGAVATEQELLDDISTRLARFKCPRSIEIVNELPYLLTGKVLRRALRT